MAGLAWYWSAENPCVNCGATSNTSHYPSCPNYGLFSAEGHPIPVQRKVNTMDELVYFSASFHCIPLRLADSIREHLMQIPNLGQFNFDYSQPIIPEED